MKVSEFRSASRIDSTQRAPSRGYPVGDRGRENPSEKSRGSGRSETTHHNRTRPGLLTRPAEDGWMDGAPDNRNNSGAKWDDFPRLPRPAPPGAARPLRIATLIAPIGTAWKASSYSASFADCITRRRRTPRLDAGLISPDSADSRSPS